ncbi:MAG TPA: sulfotransferase [Solirubrobacteraceae bacterium]
MPAQRPSRLPDFFLAGHPKCGTTALYDMLRRHPQVFMPEVKEPRWFAPDLRSPYRSGPDGQSGFENYLALFEPALPTQLIGEGSTCYVWSRQAAGLIAEAQPQARIVVILREPGSLLRSLHLQMLQHKSEEVPSLREALELEARRRNGELLTEINREKPAYLMYMDRVRFLEQLQRLHGVFGREQVLVLIYEDFRADNDATLRTVQRFLGIEEIGAVEISQANPSVQRRVWLDNALHSAFFGGGRATRWARRAAKTVIPQALSRRSFQLLRRKLVFTEPKGPDADLMGELRRRLAPEVTALSEYLGRDLVALWGYDRL